MVTPAKLQVFAATTKRLEISEWAVGSSEPEPGCAPRSLSSPHISPKRQPPLSRDPTYRCRAAFPMSPLTHNPGNLAPASAATPQAPAARAAHGQGSSREQAVSWEKGTKYLHAGVGNRNPATVHPNCLEGWAADT